MTTLSIRPADFAQDHDTISRLMHDLQAHERTIRPQRDTWDNIKRDYMVHLQAAVLENDGVCLFAEDNGQVVGMICGWIEQPDEPAMDSNEPAYGYIGEGIVTMSHQRRGVYQMLMAAMEADFKAKHVEVVRTVTIHGNDGINRFLAKNGFVPYYTCFEKKIA